MPVAIRISGSLRPRSSAVGALAFVASIALHAGAILARGHVPPAEATRPALDSLEIAINWEVEPRAVEMPVDSEPVEAREQQARASAPLVPHRHDYPTPSAHAAEPHDSGLVHPPLPSPAARPEFALAPVVSAPRDEPVRFVMHLAENGAARASGGRGIVSVSDEVRSEQPSFAEGAVDVPARLLNGVPTAYPDSARAAELEGDVELEIRVDSQGTVVSARALTSLGFGLEAAAVQAVRLYRFSAALRQGRPVPVRMRWTVSFRLR